MYRQKYLGSVATIQTNYFEKVIKEIEVRVTETVNKNVPPGYRGGNLTGYIGTSGHDEPYTTGVMSSGGGTTLPQQPDDNAEPLNLRIEQFQVPGQRTKQKIFTPAFVNRPNIPAGRSWSSLGCCRNVSWCCTVFCNLGREKG